jgi:hypothetical protein
LLELQGVRGRASCAQRNLHWQKSGAGGGAVKGGADQRPEC